jgi:hypothetical protein
MDAGRFALLLRSLSASPSRRSAVRLLVGLVLGSPLALGRAGIDAHDASKKCKKKSGKAKKKCRKKAKKHAAAHASEPPPRVPVAVPTYQCPGPRTNNTAGFTATSRLAQSFTAGMSGPLHQIQIGVNKTSGTMGDYVVELLDLDVDGKPTNTVLATATIPNPGVPVGASMITASFAGPPLVAGVEYAVALSRPEGTSLPNFFWQSRNPDVCAGSGFSQDTGTSPFIPADVDLVVFVIVLV